MPASRAVVFDLDDTLYPEHDYMRSGFAAAARWVGAELGRPVQATLDRFLELSRVSTAGVFDRWADETGVDRASARSLVHVYRDHVPDIRLAPEVRDLLSRLRTRYRLGLVTDGYLAVQERKASALGLERYLDAIVFSDTHGRVHWKPSSRPFEVVTAELDVPPDRAVYVADNPLKDFLGARRAGLRSIRLRPGAGVYVALEPETEEHAPDAEIPSLTALEKALEALENG